jgi:hypothetical protein
MPGMLGFNGSIFVAIVFGVGLPAATVALGLLAWTNWRVLHQLRSSAQRAFSGRPGPQVFSGRVISIDDGRSPVEVVVEQEGSEIEVKDGHSVDWTEVRRTARFEPFEVETEGGVRVRVEPDPDTKLVDEMDEVELVATGRRIRRAVLSEGEHVHVVGALRPSATQRTAPSAYRGGIAKEGARPLVMRGAPLAPLLLSTRPLGADRRGPLALHTVTALLFASLTLFFHGWQLSDFYRSLLAGEVVTAVAVDTREQSRWVKTKSGGHLEHEHFATFAYALDGGPKDTAEIRVGYELHEVARKRGLQTEIRVTRGPDPVAFLGRLPLLPKSSVAVGALGILLGALWGLVARATRPWYERRRFDERTQGRLPIVTSLSKAWRPDAPPPGARPNPASGDLAAEVEADAGAEEEAAAEAGASGARVRASRSPPGT